MIIRINAPKGTSPRTNPRNLANDQAQTATNVDLRSGKIVPFGIDSSVNHVNTVAGAINSIYHFATNTAAPKFIEWLASNVSVVRGATAQNTNERTYYTGDGTPKKLDDTRVDVAGNITPLEMGIPQPSAPSAGATPNADAGLNETTSYVVTYYTSWGEEGEPSLPSANVTFDSTAVSIAVSGLPTAPPAGAYSISGIRIYRAATGFAGTQYQFVAQTAFTGTYTDTTDTSSLAEVLSTTGFTAPPATMQGLVSMPNGIMAAYNGSDLLFSEPYQPHAWPVSYMLSVNSPIVGLAAFGNSLLIATQDVPYIATGVHPSAMTLQKLEVNQSCVSHRSVVDMGYYAAYASPDGMVTVGINGAQVSTLPLFTRTEWQALNPSSIHGYFSDGRYIGFYDATATGGVRGGFILDPNNPDFGVTWLDNWYVAGYSDSIDDSLYLITEFVGTTQPDIVKFDSGASKTATWKSKVFVLPYPVSFSCAQVRGVLPVTLNVYAEGAIKHSHTVSNDSPFHLPSGFRATEWEVEVSGTGTVYSIALAGSFRELGRV